MKRNLIHVFTIVWFIIALAVTNSNGGVQQHSVQKGDTLWNISRKYKVPLKSIAQVNQIKLTERLQIGEKLLIPGTSSQDAWYFVKAEDTLWNISRKYKVPLKSIAQANQIKLTERLQIGEKLLIPGTSSQDAWYFVKAGDTLWNISRRYNVEVWDLQAANGISSPRQLQIGTRIRIPNGEDLFTFASPLRVPLVVTSKYGYRSHPVTGRYQIHEGIDFRAATGTRVYASRAGKVIFAGRKGGYGKVVGIEHEDDFTTWYGHLSRIKVKSGQWVSQGKVIGLSGNTGLSTGPHLHFEIRYKGRSEKPTQYLTIQ